jgi:hypothetical protein
VLLMTMPVRPLPTPPPHYETAAEEHNVILCELAEEHGWWLVDATSEFRSRWDQLEPEFTDLVHLGPDGDLVKARLVADTLIAGSGTAGTLR